MNKNQSLAKAFKYVYPALAVAAWLIAFAVIFNTFQLTFSAALYNLLLALPILGVMLMAIRRFPAAVIAAAAVAYVICYVDSFVFSVRLTHIRFSDFMQTGQALRVANRYLLIWNWELTRRLLIAAVLCVLVVLIARYYKLEYRKRTVFFTGLGLFAVGAIILFSGVLPHESEDFDFTSAAEQNGLLYSWYCQYHESKMTEPEGYSEARAQELLAAYEPTAGEPGAEEINIIVIMNESLTDYALLGETPFAADPLPNLHGYTDNYFYGKLAVSVFGGGTCNTEYEFLTGNATAFLPEGAMPFLQYVLDDEYSLARELGALGYTKTAVHPYYSEEWNRTQVYRFLGFDEFISGADFGNTVVTNGMKATARPSENLISFGEGPLYVRGLISDQSCFERVLEEAGERSFVFAVTMQNHGGYRYDGENFENTDYVTDADRRIPERPSAKWRENVIGRDLSGETEEVNQYLTCASLSDAAFKQLTDELETRDQKTIVLMFGDHQPALLVPEDYMRIEDFDETMYYDVPYLLWANFDIEFDAPEYTSPNYLSAILKKNAGLPLTAWDQYRLDVMAQYPVVTTNKILDAEGNRVDPAELNDYAVVQYYRMFESTPNP